MQCNTLACAWQEHAIGAIQATSPLGQSGCEVSQSRPSQKRQVLVIEAIWLTPYVHSQRDLWRLSVLSFSSETWISASWFKLSCLHYHRFWLRILGDSEVRPQQDQQSCQNCVGTDTEEIVFNGLFKVLSKYQLLVRDVRRWVKWHWLCFAGCFNFICAWFDLISFENFRFFLPFLFLW